LAFCEGEKAEVGKYDGVFNGMGAALMVAKRRRRKRETRREGVSFIVAWCEKPLLADAAMPD